MPLKELANRFPILAQASRFATVGLANTAVDLIFFSLFFYLLSWHLLAANAVSFSIAATCSYLMNKAWTFADKSQGSEALRRGLAFLAVATVGLAIGSAIIWLAATVLPPILAKLTSIVGTFPWNFVASRRWVFRSA